MKRVCECIQTNGSEIEPKNILSQTSDSPCSGGEDQPELYQFRFADHQWIKLTPICNQANPCPVGRIYHRGVYATNLGFVSYSLWHISSIFDSETKVIISHENFKVILGGINSQLGFMEDVWAYDPSANVWTQLPDKPENTSWKDFALCFDYISMSIYFHGGNIRINT